MADSMTLTRIAFAAIAMTLGAGSAAQALTDPTRPPLELMRTATVSDQAATAPPAMPLQSILLSSARKGAVLGGQYVPLGGKFGNATLVKITATAVTLKSDQGLEVLQLYAPAPGAPGTASAEPKPDKAARTP